MSFPWATHLGSGFFKYPVVNTFVCDLEELKTKVSEGRLIEPAKRLSELGHRGGSTAERLSEKGPLYILSPTFTVSYLLALIIGNLLLGLVLPTLSTTREHVYRIRRESEAGQL